MNKKKLLSIFTRKNRSVKKKRTGFFPFNRLGGSALNKRQKFVILVLIMSIGLFITEYLLGKSGFFVVVLLSALAAFLFYVAVYSDIKENKSLYVFILPLFVYTLAVGLFYFLVPARFLSRILITLLYGVGLYSLSLSQNIFIVASLRTIPLLSGARIVSFVLTLVSYFFLMTVAFSLDLPLYFVAPLLILFTFLTVFQSIAVTFEKQWSSIFAWVFSITLCLSEISFILWFWPTSNPAFLAAFMTGFFYSVVGPAQVWLERRLFRGVMWWYIWLGVLSFLLLLVFTSWKA